MTSSLSTTSSKVPVGAVLLAGIGAQFVDDIAFALLPPIALLAPVSGLIAVLLTAGAARYASKDRVGAAVARTGLAVGAVSASVGLIVGDLNVLTWALAALTIIAGVAGAIVGRRKDGVEAG